MPQDDKTFPTAQEMRTEVYESLKKIITNNGANEQNIISAALAIKQIFEI